MTHSVTFLSQCDRIVVLKDGSISESGTYKELTDKKGDFADFLLTYLKENTEEPDKEGNSSNLIFLHSNYSYLASPLLRSLLILTN